jgi:hypothetical protein
MHSRRDELLTAVRGGATVTIAARRLGIPRATVYSWKARDAEFGEALSEAVRGQRGVVKLAPDDRGARPPDREELMRRLDEQSRAGSTRATELLLKALPAEPAGDTGAVRRLLALVPSE